MVWKGQGPVEYIIVIVIVLVVAGGIMLAILGQGDDSTVIEQGSSIISRQSQEIQVEDTALHPDGNFYFLISNKSTSTIKIKTINISGLDAEFNQGIYNQNEKEFIVNTNIHCTEWDFVYLDVYIKYETGYGLEKTQHYPSEVGMLCEKFSLVHPKKAVYTTVLRAE